MKFPSFDKFLEKVTLNDDVDEDDYLDDVTHRDASFGNVRRQTAGLSLL